MLKAMEESGLIYREADEKDKRGVKIKMTEEGKRKTGNSQKNSHTL
jgi:DNA-binding MarR family transcriptional regulator